MRKGEVWLVELPSSGGQEQEGLRPAIIFATTEMGIATVIPLTSNLQGLRFQHTYLVEKSEANKLTADSIALIFQLRALDSKRLKKKLGELESKHLSKINDLLAKYLNL
mgnify:CR=1 FL=1